MRISPPSAADFSIFIYIKMKIYITSTSYKSKIFAACGGDSKTINILIICCYFFSAPAAPIFPLYIKMIFTIYKKFPRRLRRRETFYI